MVRVVGATVDAVKTSGLALDLPSVSTPSSKVSAATNMTAVGTAGSNIATVSMATTMTMVMTRVSMTRLAEHRAGDKNSQDARQTHHNPNSLTLTKA